MALWSFDMIQFNIIRHCTRFDAPKVDYDSEYELAYVYEDFFWDDRNRDSSIHKRTFIKTSRFVTFYDSIFLCIDYLISKHENVN